MVKVEVQCRTATLCRFVQRGHVCAHTREDSPSIITKSNGKERIETLLFTPSTRLVPRSRSLHTTYRWSGHGGCALPSELKLITVGNAVIT